VLLPGRGFLKASDRRSLKSLQDDLEDSSKCAVNIQTGHIYFKKEVQHKDQNIDQFFQSNNKEW